MNEYEPDLEQLLADLISEAEQELETATMDWRVSRNSYWKARLVQHAGHGETILRPEERDILEDAAEDLKPHTERVAFWETRLGWLKRLNLTRFRDR